MSRIGRAPIPYPKDKVEVLVEGDQVTVKGPKGTLTRKVRPELSVRVDNGRILVERHSDEPMHRALHGLTRTLIANMVKGVTEGYEKVLEIVGVGYRAQKEGNSVVLQVGYSHPVKVEPRPGIEFEVTQDVNTRNPLIIVRGIDKEVVGQQAAEIRAIKKPEPYKGKGIRYRGEYVRRKAGKSAKAGGKGR
jgi:large subunit ribosomal protein L6